MNDAANLEGDYVNKSDQLNSPEKDQAPRDKAQSSESVRQLVEALTEIVTALSDFLALYANGWLESRLNSCQDGGTENEEVGEVDVDPEALGIGLDVIERVLGNGWFSVEELWAAYQERSNAANLRSPMPSVQELTDWLEQHKGIEANGRVLLSCVGGDAWRIQKANEDSSSTSAPVRVLH
jgi:hypothetical protein